MMITDDECFKNQHAEDYTDSFLLRPYDLCSEKLTRIGLRMSTCAMAVAL